MMPISVTINDYPCDAKSVLSLSMSDIRIGEEKWTEKPNPYLKLWAEEPAFAGYESFSELTLDHLRFILTATLNQLAKLNARERADLNQPVVSLTNLTVMLVIMKLEESTKCSIEHFRINRFNEYDVTYDFSATSEIQYDRPEGKPTFDEPTLSIL